MGQVIRILRLLARVLIGYVLTIAASLLALAAVPGAWQDLLGRAFQTLPGAWLAITFMGVASATPFIAAVGIGEVNGIRHWWFYVLMAELPVLLLLMPLGLSLVSGGLSTVLAEGTLGWTLSVAVAAFAGGWVYWAVSGRYAGLEAEVGRTESLRSGRRLPETRTF